MPGVDGRYRVLIVDDEPVIRLLLDRVPADAVTRRWSPSTPPMLSGDRSTTHRLISLVTDVLMPDMAGDELVYRIRESQSDLEVLYVTGFADRLFWEKPELDHEAFVEKPVSPEGLLEAVSFSIFGHTRGGDS